MPMRSRAESSVVSLSVDDSQAQSTPSNTYSIPNEESTTDIRIKTYISISR